MTPPRGSYGHMGRISATTFDGNGPFEPERKCSLVPQEGGEFKGHVWIDAHTCVAFIFEPDGNAYIGVGSAERGDSAPRDKSWERAQQAAGRLGVS